MTIHGRIFSALTIATLAACAPPASHINGSVLPEGSAVMDNCRATEALIVENGTAYPVRVVATDNSPASSIGSAQLVEIVQQQTVDTIPRLAQVHPKLQFDLEQPALPSGSRPPIRGLRARCVPRP